MSEAPPAAATDRPAAAIRSGASRAAAIGSLGLFGTVMMCLSGRWDAVAAITIIPLWVWAFFGLAAAAGGLLACRTRSAALAALLWGGTLLAGPDEWRGLWRSWFSNPPPLLPQRPAAHRAQTLRVITLNCRRSNIASAREAAAWNPDVILLQEMRGYATRDVNALARELWGPESSTVASFDTTILAHGHLRPHPSSRTNRRLQEFVQATLTRPDGSQIEIASVHLQGHVTSLKLWDLETWRAHARKQRRHRLYMEEVIVPSMQSGQPRPRLIGGDFNSPAGNRTFAALQPSFVDAFATVGTGWGNTFRNDWPLLRIDQIWATHDLQPTAARTIKTDYSDHRMVVVDYTLPTTR